MGPAGASGGGSDVPLSETEGSRDGPLSVAQEKVALCKCLTNLDGHGCVTMALHGQSPSNTGGL